MKRKRSNNQGFTLVEVVVAFCVSAILFSSMIAIMAPIYKIYARTRERSDAQLVAGVVLDSIRAACATTGTLVVADNGGTLKIDAKRGFFVQDSRLMFSEDLSDDTKAEAVLAEGVYNGKTIAMVCSQQTGSGPVNVMITVTGSDDAVCKLNSAVSPMRAVANTVP